MVLCVSVSPQGKLLWAVEEVPCGEPRPNAPATSHDEYQLCSPKPNTACHSEKKRAYTANMTVSDTTEGKVCVPQGQ